MMKAFVLPLLLATHSSSKHLLIKTREAYYDIGKHFLIETKPGAYDDYTFGDYGGFVNTGQITDGATQNNYGCWQGDFHTSGKISGGATQNNLGRNCGGGAPVAPAAPAAPPPSTTPTCVPGEET